MYGSLRPRREPVALYAVAEQIAEVAAPMVAAARAPVHAPPKGRTPAITRGGL